jgi:hypothetical protein
LYSLTAQRLQPSTLDADLRPMHRALADLIERRKSTIHMPIQRAMLARMIHDLEVEMAIRKLVLFPMDRRRI